jgi:outer membrane protein assembly factor BamE (lipoprotein component of BamABCDE complex)
MNKILNLEEPTNNKSKYNYNTVGNAMMVILLIIWLSMIGGLISHFNKEPSELPSFEEVSKVEVGMSKDEVFDLLGEKPWSYYDKKGFYYQWKFISPKGKDRFQATIKDNKVIDFHSGVNYTYYRTYKNNLK